MTTGKPKRRLFFPWLGKRLLLLCLVLVGISALLTLPLRWLNPPTTAFVLQDENRGESRLYTWTAFDALGDNLVLAVVAAEDQRFAQHSGLDLESIQDSLEERKNGGRLRGASTLSQQLVKNLYLWGGRSLFRKGLEAWLSVNLEVYVSKRRILELYLNVVEFGPGIYGAAEASQHYFDKQPAQLTEGEAALLAAVLPSPKRYRVKDPSAFMRERQTWIQSHMARLKREQWLTVITD